MSENPHHFTPLPPHCNGRHGCTNQHHVAYQCFMNALAEAKSAAEAIRDLPLPPPEQDPDPEWHLDEQDTHEIILEDVAGLLWALNYITTCVESVTLSCCWSEHRRREVAAHTTAEVARLLCPDVVVSRDCPGSCTRALGR